MDLDLSQINDIDLSHFGDKVNESEFRGYFLGNAGREHYKLLAYFSTLFNNQTLLDIGTYKGCSALALAFNKNNSVKSFDLGDYRRIKNEPNNIDFILDDFTNEKYKDIVLQSPLIMLDTDHDGPFEYKAYNYLKDINWEGYLLLDDIHLNDPMKEFWNQIDIQKSDITSVGHWSGTGLVIFTKLGIKMVNNYNKESYITQRLDPHLWKNHCNVLTMNSYSKYICGHVLDIGCNHACSTYWLKDLNVTKITGVDINKKSLDKAKDVLNNLNNIPYELIEKNYAYENIGIEFDTIISFHTLEHIYPTDSNNFVQNIYSDLKNNGYFIIGIPYEHAYSDPCHVSFYNEASLKELMEKVGFITIECFKDDRFNEKNILTGLFQKI